MDNKQSILLESGTNEFEIVEFTVGEVIYGINVAKVREVINTVPVTKMPNAHKFVDGVFTLRGKVIPLVNLARCLNATSSDSSSRIIVSELNNHYVGFLVDEVSRIHRISWTALEPAPNIVNSKLVVGIIKMTDKMVILLDFEKIIAEINPEVNQAYQNIVKAPEDILAKRATKTILVAEDSHMLRDLLIDTLHRAGYTNIVGSVDGLDAWNKLENFTKDNTPIEKNVQLVITDIEMPQMDGHHLLKKMQASPKYEHVPVFIFSSLINEENRRKGEALGAKIQVSKPQIDELIKHVDEYIL